MSKLDKLLARIEEQAITIHMLDRERDALKGELARALDREAELRDALETTGPVAVEEHPALPWHYRAAIKREQTEASTEASTEA